MTGRSGDAERADPAVTVDSNATDSADSAGQAGAVDASRDGSDESPLDPLVSGTRIGQFVSVGAVGATVETLIVALLTTLAAFPPLGAKAVGAEVSISLMFLLNDRYTFGTEGSTGAAALVRRWGRSHLVRLGGLAVAFSVLWLLTARTDVTLLVAGRDLWPTVANVAGIGVGLVLNYVAESLFTWRVLE